MATDPSMDRYAMTAERYLAQHRILMYLEDSVGQLLEHREENPKVNALKYLAEYFTTLRDGNHTMFREYAFVKASPHNRASFIGLFWNSFKQIGERGDLLSIKEYHSLVQLLCPDFPFVLLQKTARIILMDDALDCLIAFSDFLYAFQAQFYYEEFLEKSTEIYKSLQQSQQSPRETVVVPSSTDDQPSVKHKMAPQTQDSVEGSVFFRMLYQLCDRAEFSVPPVSVLKELLDMPQVTYYSFLMFIAKSASINQAIGQLPEKAELFDGVNRELNIPSLYLSSGKGNTIQAAVDTPSDSQPRKCSGKSIRGCTSNPSLVHIRQKPKHGVSKEFAVNKVNRADEKSSSSESSGDSNGSTTD